MKLDLIIATFNRSSALRSAMTSIFAAQRVPELELCVTIVDTSTDDTCQVVKQFQERNELNIRYIFEPRRGKSVALNTGIRQSSADLIALTDDDIEVSEDWFVEIFRLFKSRWDEIDFAGGKVLPRWEALRPQWLPRSVEGVLSVHDHGDREIPYGTAGFDAQLTGAHGVVKRSALLEVGLYNETLGPVGGSLLGSEDDDMYNRLLRAGKHGIYCPRLAVYHRIPAYRLTRRYYRQWSYAWGASQSMIDSDKPYFHGPRILGIPRYLYGNAVRGTGRMLTALLTYDRERYFANELNWWILAGFLYDRKVKMSPFRGLVDLILGDSPEKLTR